MAWRIVQTILLPPIVIGGFFVASEAGGVIQDAWDGFLGPFLFTYWVGLGFTNAWFIMKEQLHVSQAGPTTVLIAVVVVILALLSMLGGPGALMDDPWLFGVVIWPGIEIALPYVREHRHAAMRAVEDGSDTAPPSA